MRNRFVILIALGVVTLLWLISRCAAQTPSGLYTLRDLAWDGPGTNWQVLVRLQTNALPIASIESRIARSAVSNLNFNTTYWLSVKAQSNGVWSAESVSYKWPHTQTNYASYIGQTSPSVNGTWADVPGSLRTEINPAFYGDLWRVKIWYTNNLTPFIFTQ